MHKTLFYKDTTDIQTSSFQNPNIVMTIRPQNYNRASKKLQIAVLMPNNSGQSFHMDS